jgi:hypothetical protein
MKEQDGDSMSLGSPPALPSQMDSCCKDSNYEEQKTNQNPEHNELGRVLKHGSKREALLPRK